MRILLVVAAAFVLAILWSLHEGKRAHALDVSVPRTPTAQLTDQLPPPVADATENVTKPLTPIVQPVVTTLQPIVEPVVDTVAPIVSPLVTPVVNIARPLLPPAPPLPPVFDVPNIAPHGPSATAVANVVATAVAQVAGNARSGIARGFTDALDGVRSLPLPHLAMPVVPLPARPVSFPSPVPLSHTPGGLGRTSGGSLAVLWAAAAVASLRGRRLRLAAGVGQPLFLASLIERPG